jgi:hypothetical protein
MSVPTNLPAQIAESTNEQLLAMLKEPGDWIPEALDAARAELQRRGVDSAAASMQPQAVEVNVAPDGRPLAITVICVFGFIGAPVTILLGIYRALHPLISAPPWYPVFLVLAGAWRLGCMIGLWRMSRIAFFALVLYLCTDLVMVSTLTPRAIAFSLIPFLVQLAIGRIYYHRLK